MQKTLNVNVKYRESFRPFVPSVLREYVGEWFGFDGDSTCMLLVDCIKNCRRCAVAKEEKGLFGIDKPNIVRSETPSVTHVDYSARMQTVHADTIPYYHALISKFYEKTVCPVVVNVSFDARGEPIVNTPEDAFDCFMEAEIDLLTIGSCLVWSEHQDPALKKDYKNAFDLD